MIQLNQMKFGLDHNLNDIKNRITKVLRIDESEILDFEVLKKSVDARKKQDIKIVYNIGVDVRDENKFKHIKLKNVVVTKKKQYLFNAGGEKQTKKDKENPIIVGSGPAGLFCALMLVENGYKPLIIERGKEVDQRFEDVEKFWNTGELNKESNVQFGEGGAGTFSDGKLNTLVKDKFGRNRKVLEILVENGAPEEILYINKPHIGTDILRTVVKNMRNKILELGGTIKFNTKLTDIIVDNNKISKVVINNNETLKCSMLVLAIGHSARDTFEMLYSHKLDMSSKAMAVGVRIEHPQEMISKNQYGEYYQNEHLPVGEYKLTHQCLDGRGVYSFCMCPGGFVVNASSESERVVVNGMSNYARNEENANSAIIVTVHPDDYMSAHPLAGLEFQRNLEEEAYRLGGSDYSVPVQLLGDFLNNEETTELKNVKSSIKRIKLTDLNKGLPPFIANSLKEGILAFDKKIQGFARPDAILSGYETRTSSPIRIYRDNNFVSNIEGIYPCGEGAGYAGGITSAAMDGIKVAEAIVIAISNVD